MKTTTTYIAKMIKRGLASVYTEEEAAKKQAELSELFTDIAMARYTDQEDGDQDDALCRKDSNFADKIGLLLDD